ncbi:DUF362 domain-containing protein [Gehongia tenuis]|uniref:DUF362 domain-containing protein n=1 Tax=Gehongia tenuis TaxID=2763655 RepID=A0A926D5V6_9FIRM|nr:DUF362 domain-containing protein [Gehongia tenuis]MBC8531434.1 DUF362 domain-containing protein [Gehongia tenuis]
MHQIHVIYGTDGRRMAKRLLEAAGAGSHFSPGMRVALKPNLVVAKPASSGATTHPEVVAGVIEFLQDLGLKNIEIMESSWVGEGTARAFKAAGYEQLSERYGVPLIDLKKVPVRAFEAGGETYQICKPVLEADALINLPVLKAHCQTLVTCALKNLKGCIPDGEKRRYHAAGLTEPIARLGSLVHPVFTVVDALCGDLTFEEGGNPVPMNRLIHGEDPVLVDAYGATLLGYDPDEIAYIPRAAAYGAGSMDLEGAEIRELNRGESGKMTPSGKVARLAAHVDARSACSACYGGLIHALNRLDEMGRLPRDLKVSIGQDFQNEQGGGLGIGHCCRGFARSVPSCPPSARAILEALLKEI